MSQSEINNMNMESQNKMGEVYRRKTVDHVDISNREKETNEFMESGNMMDRQVAPSIIKQNQSQINKRNYSPQTQQEKERMIQEQIAKLQQVEKDKLEIQLHKLQEMQQRQMINKNNNMDIERLSNRNNSKTNNRNNSNGKNSHITGRKASKEIPFSNNASNIKQNHNKSSSP